jgi:hypothetical protein
MQRLATDPLRENLQCFWSSHLFPAVQYDIIPGTQKLVIRSSFITPCPHIGYCLTHKSISVVIKSNGRAKSRKFITIRNYKKY